MAQLLLAVIFGPTAEFSSFSKKVLSPSVFSGYKGYNQRIAVLGKRRPFSWQ